MTVTQTPTEWVLCMSCDGIGAVPVRLPDGSPAHRPCPDCHPAEYGGDPHPAVVARDQGWSWPRQAWMHHIGYPELDAVWDRIQDRRAKAVR